MRATTMELLTPYLLALRGIPTIRSVEPAPLPPGDAADVELVIETDDGITRLVARVARVNAGYDVAERAVAALAGRPGLLLAPVIGAPLGAWLIERGVGYVDARGNCDLRLGGRTCWHVEGRTPTGSGEPAAKGLRAPGFQVLYALLALPELLGATVRDAAAAAGTSRQAVVDLMRRLVDEGVLIRRGKGRTITHRWMEPRRKDALDLWVQGYRSTLRPHLMLGRYQLPEAEPEAMETRIAEALGALGETWRWGGASAAWRIAPWYRSPNVVVHTRTLHPELVSRLRALPDRTGPLTILSLPGTVAQTGATADTVEPLLAWTELTTQGDERDREAAQVLAQKALPWLS